MARRSRTRKRHVVKTALLIVGEGPDDQAFVKHMNQVFREESTGIRASINKESGGSPGNVIANTTRKYKNDDFDQRFIVLDSDIPISEASQQLAEKHGYAIILWNPQCLEGALLDVLGERVQSTETSQNLKVRLHPMLDGHHTEPAAYASRFPKPVLAGATNSSIVSVRDVLTGNKKKLLMS